MPENQMQAAPQAAVQGDQIRDQDKIMLVLAYLGILSLIPFLTVKDSDYVKFHSRQGLALCIVWFGWGIAGFILAFIPIIGWLLSCGGHLGFLVMAIMGIVKALKPERWRMPVVASVADMLGK
jgi:fumarate reductase subunit D